MYTKLKLQFKGYKELEFSDKSVHCTFDILITLIKNNKLNFIEFDVKKNLWKVFLSTLLDIVKDDKLQSYNINFLA